MHLLILPLIGFVISFIIMASIATIVSFLLLIGISGMLISLIVKLFMSLIKFNFKELGATLIVTIFVVASGLYLVDANLDTLLTRTNISEYFFNILAIVSNIASSPIAFLTDMDASKMVIISRILWILLSFMLAGILIFGEPNKQRYIQLYAIPFILTIALFYGKSFAVKHEADFSYKTSFAASGKTIQSYVQMYNIGSLMKEYSKAQNNTASYDVVIEQLLENNSLDKNDLIDPWGNSYHFTKLIHGGKIQIKSYGEDGVLNNKVEHDPRYSFYLVAI